MSEVPKGTQAYRWMVGIGVAATVLLATQILSTVKQTADDVNVLKIAVSTVQAMQSHQTSRIEAVERKNEAQDRDFKELSREFYRKGSP